MKTSTLNPKHAIITGATCGLGEVFAREFARRGYDLLITGRRKNLLVQLARELRTTFKVKVLPCIAEFSVSRELTRLLLAIDRLSSVEVLVNNAGFGCRKPFFKDSFANQEKMLKVHINATCRIIHRVVPRMEKNGGGIIINVSSLAAFTPLPTNYFYSASKAFLATFSESLYMNLFDSNIRVQALCPGFTMTNFHRKLDPVKDESATGRKLFWMTAESVVKKSLKAIEKNNKVIYIPGQLNKMIFRLIRIIPRGLYYSIARHLPAA